MKKECNTTHLNVSFFVTFFHIFIFYKKKVPFIHKFATKRCIRCRFSKRTINIILSRKLQNWTAAPIDETSASQPNVTPSNEIVQYFIRQRSYFLAKFPLFPPLPEFQSHSKHITQPLPRAQYRQYFPRPHTHIAIKTNGEFSHGFTPL